MASQVNVYAQLTATGFDLAPGTSDFWGTSGLDYRRMVWYAAWPLSAGEDQSLEVTHVSHEVDGSGNRWINVEVHIVLTIRRGLLDLFPDKTTHAPVSERTAPLGDMHTWTVGLQS